MQGLNRAHRALRVMSIVAVCGMLIFALSACRKQDTGEFARQTNLGKAYLENRNADKAVEHFTAALELRPKSPTALRNITRAYLLARKHEEALETIGRAREAEPESPAAHYLRGLLLARLSRFDDAAVAFEAAVRLDAKTAALRFQLATAYQAVGRHEKAAEQLRETVRLDHLHASAFYKLSSYARREQDTAQFERTHREFMRLRKMFGDETRSAEALEICRYTRPEAAPTEDDRKGTQASGAVAVRFTDATASAFASADDRVASAAAVIEFDGDDGYTIITVGPGGQLSLLRWNQEGDPGVRGGAFVRTTLESGLPGGVKYDQCVVGNFHDDVPADVKYDARLHARNDLLLIGGDGLRLMKRTGPTALTDVTVSSGLAGLTANAARWMDYDHDGDLDLLLARQSGVEMWQNNGDATFENVSAHIGLDDGGPSTDLAAIDLDANVAVDFIIAKDALPSVVFENQRAGRFARMPEPPGPLPPARRILVDDLDNDGRADVVLLSSETATILPGGHATRRRIDLAGTNWTAAVLLDFDNDGWLDICVVGADQARADKGVVRLWRNVGGKAWVEKTVDVGLDSINMPPLADVLAFDVDADGDTDLLLVGADNRLRFVRNDGGHTNGQLKIKLLASKTNPSGFGTHVEIRSGDFWVTRSVADVAIEIGLAGVERLDSVQTIWTNGVIDNQIDVAAATSPLAIVEKKVATGSCPFLYAWDGTGLRFVTDILGNSPIGLSLKRDVVLPADPDEIVLIGAASSFPPKGDYYTVEITDEFRELVYLDEVRLVAVDHTPSAEIHSTDKIMPPPFPPSEVWALESLVTPVKAVGSDDVDCTLALRAIDGMFASPGSPLPPPYRGMCQPHSITLDFGPLDAAGPLVIALTGWLQYGDASTNIAISQNSAIRPVMPTLSAEDGSGEWIPIDVVVGMPAGKTKTILCDLTGKLPPSARRLRLSTTYEIRWDRIALSSRHPLDENNRHEAKPSSARLYHRGFSELRQRQPNHPTTPAYEDVSEIPPWRTAQQGWCTRYGNVLELVSRRDDRIAILNAGDALALGFDAESFPPIPDGLMRSFFLYSVGWDKDEDYNVVSGNRVEPLPVRRKEVEGGVIGMADEYFRDWRLEYNTRWVAGDRFERTR